MVVASLLPIRCKSDRKWLGAFLRGIFNDNFIPLVRVCRMDDQSMRGDAPGQSVSSSKAIPSPAEPRVSEIHSQRQSSEAHNYAGKISGCAV